MTLGFALIISLAAVSIAEAAPRLSNMFGDHQVLQREMPVPVWGTAEPGEAVTVKFAAQSLQTAADANGRWQITLSPMAANAEGQELTVVGENGVSVAKISGVLVGDVWLCAGSAGEFERSTARLFRVAAEEVAKASFPQVRLLRPHIYTSVLPVEETNAASWTVVSPQGIGPFPSTWYFGRELNAATGVPVGLILVHKNSETTGDWLASKLDSQDSRQAQAITAMKERLPENVASAQRWLTAFKTWKPSDPIEMALPPVYLPYAFYGGYHPDFKGPHPFANTRSSAYNFLVAPYTRMALRGVVFFNDFGRRFLVTGEELSKIVHSWREAWARPEMPFVMVPPMEQSQPAAQADKALVAVAGMAGVHVLTRSAEAQTPGLKTALWREMAAAAKEMPIGTVGTLPTAQTQATLLEVAPARSSFEVAAIFGDHMVLQSGKPVPVWGWGTPGARVSVSFAGQSQETWVNKEGEWRVTLEPLAPSTTSSEMTITSQQGAQKENRTLLDALVGEVWLNSGQSNAGFALGATTGFSEEQPKAHWPEIRYFMSWKTGSVLPLRRPHGKWVVVTPETASSMPGQGYYFAKQIHQQLKAPVGIIEASLGGSTIFAWMADAALAASHKLEPLYAQRVRMRDQSIAELPAFEEALARWIKDVSRNGRLERPMPYHPVYMGAIHAILKPMEDRGGELYNVMIHPLRGSSMRGVLWNQGEADTGAGIRSEVYDELMQRMVADWRKSWADPFPFYFVQMPAIPGRNGLTQMWEKQTLAMQHIPNSGMIVCNDIVDGDIHPRNKKDVGERLARLALVRTYGIQGIMDSSPFMKSVTREGNEVVVMFAHSGEGLQTRDGKASDCWEVAGTDGKLVPACAVIVGDRVRVSAEGITKPTVVRLGWFEHSNCNLINSAGLPAMPFSAKLE
jgi:hypothetical protein